MAVLTCRPCSQEQLSVLPCKTSPPLLQPCGPSLFLKAHTILAAPSAFVNMSAGHASHAVCWCTFSYCRVPIGQDLHPNVCCAASLTIYWPSENVLSHPCCMPPLFINSVQARTLARMRATYVPLLHRVQFSAMTPTTANFVPIGFIEGI